MSALMTNRAEGHASAAAAIAVTKLEAKTPRLIFGLTRHQKIVSFKLSYCMAHVDALKRQEKPGSRLYVKLCGLEEHLGSVLDEYRIQRFHTTDLNKAAALFDTLDAKIQEMYP